MSEKEQRIMRMALPVSLIREMDAVIIQGLGGYRTRAEFIVDAIQERILEVTIGETEDAGPPPPTAACARPLNDADGVTGRQFQRDPHGRTSDPPDDRPRYTC